MPRPERRAEFQLEIPEHDRIDLDQGCRTRASALFQQSFGHREPLLPGSARGGTVDIGQGLEGPAL